MAVKPKAVELIESDDEVALVECSIVAKKELVAKKEIKALFRTVGIVFGLSQAAVEPRNAFGAEHRLAPAAFIVAS